LTTSPLAAARAAEPPSESSPQAPVEPPPPPPTLLEQLFRFSERFGHMVSRVVLTLLYVVLVGPAALLLTTIGDPLRIRRWRGTSWDAWREDVDSPARARSQD
jgi:hypothetical protein